MFELQNDNEKSDKDLYEEMDNQLSNVRFNDPQEDDKNCLKPTSINVETNKENKNILNYNMANRKHYFEDKENLFQVNLRRKLTIN